MGDFSQKLKNISSINLDQLNSQASFLDRIDRKFLLTATQLEDLLSKFKKDFYVLQIGDKKVFSYENVYMDTFDYLFYNQHQNKIKPRIKVRTRLYKDSNIAFFEFKQKQKKVTRKFRYEIPVGEYGVMTKESKGFYKGVTASFSPLSPSGISSSQGRKKGQAPKISPAIQTSYSRMTLVNKDSSERITIDFNITTKDIRNSGELIGLDNLVIIESKSMRKRCRGVEILKQAGFKKAKSCSKYSLGVIYSGLAQKFSTFERTMEEIERIRREL